MKRLAAAVILGITVFATVSNAAVVERTALDEIRVTTTHNISEFTFESVGGYDYIRGEDLVYLSTAGLPGLPRKAYRVTIPWDAHVRSIEARCLTETAVDGTFRIVPTQPPAILGQSQAEWVGGREDVYSLDGLYPADLVGGAHEGFMGNSRIVSFEVSPFRWNPVTGQLVLCEGVEIRLQLEESQIKRPFRRGSSDSQAFFNMVERSVANPHDVQAYQPATVRPRFLSPSMLPAGEYEYVIVTADSMVPYFQPLVDWKNQRGIPATSVTLEWIEANYAGDDIQMKARNFITDAYETWGIIWVLLGGDTRILPSRTVYAMDCEMGGVAGNKIRCDLYFGDLDGTWNANGVTPYGEVADSVDMYPEVFVGRAPAENIAEAIVFVDKVITYEKSPPADYALKMLMAGEVMWTSPYTDGGVGLNMIDDDCVPPRFDPILKLYESLGNESPETVLDAMSDGQNMILHDGHCNEYSMGAGTGYINYLDAGEVTNGTRTFILNSIGCWPAAIDRDCIAERFMNNPDGGCVAFIGNSRYGWGSPGNPGFGYSDKFQYEFVKSIYVNEVFPLGEAHAESKAVFVGFAGGENVYRWNEYQLNLLGDPEMPLWTDDPVSLVVTASDSVMASGDMLTVVVEDAAGVVEGALVCIMNDSDLYVKGRTDISGAVTLAVSTASPDSLLLTVSANNHVPGQRMIAVVMHGIMLAWTGAAVSDGGDGMANPGETIDLDVTVKNFGTEPDSGVWGTLRATDGLCTVTDSTVYYGQLGAGQEVTGNGFTVEFDGSFANGDVAVFDLMLTDSTSNQWTSRVPVTVAGPVLYIASYGIDDRLGGDGDWIAEPGETVLVTLEIANGGLTYTEVDAYLTGLDPQFDAEDSVTYAGQIDPGMSGYSRHKVTVSAGCPLAHLGMLEVAIDGTGGYDFADTVYFSVGDLCYMDDLESGEGTWVHAGAPDLWHLSSYRSHSDSMSWYFGSESTHEYPSNADGNIVSQDFIAGEDNRLSFWFWYDFTTYGTDGAYVIVLTNGVADTLDFIGSGGALGDRGALNIVSGWTEWDYMLAGVEPGDTVTVEFGFISDNVDVAEGIYIDDVSFRCKTPVVTGIDEVPDPAGDVAFRAYPNPARGALTISFTGRADQFAVDIYTVEGRLVNSIVKTRGAASVSWDLMDRDGSRVAPGIYLAKTRGSTYPYSGKIVVLR
ncbi:MAG: C25 family cysteine peptidase [Candidatus Eisenbacteria bacterium]